MAGALRSACNNKTVPLLFRTQAAPYGVVVEGYLCKLCHLSFYVIPAENMATTRELCYPIFLNKRFDATLDISCYIPSYSNLFSFRFDFTLVLFETFHTTVDTVDLLFAGEDLIRNRCRQCGYIMNNIEL